VWKHAAGPAFIGFGRCGPSRSFARPVPPQATGAAGVPHSRELDALRARNVAGGLGAKRR